jgi:hypothetical protein
MPDAIISPTDLMLGAVSEALARVGVKERKGTPNSGDEIDLFLAAVGLPPGKSWCAAFVHFCYRVAAAKLSTVNPCPRTGGCLRLWELADAHWKTQTPAEGAIYVLDHGGGLGHAGIVSVLMHDGSVASEISGNTNKQGMRDGNQVAVHYGPPELSHHGRLVGYLNFALPAPPLVA